MSRIGNFTRLIHTHIPREEEKEEEQKHRHEKLICFCLMGPRGHGRTKIIETTFLDETFTRLRFVVAAIANGWEAKWSFIRHGRTKIIETTFLDETFTRLRLVVAAIANGWEAKWSFIRENRDKTAEPSWGTSDNKATTALWQLCKVCT